MTDAVSIKSPVESLFADISVAMHQWHGEQAKTIHTTIRKRLDNHADEVLMKLMGFERGYGQEWKIDHCNGRNGNSNISDFLKTAQEATVKEWLAGIPLPTLTPAMKKSLAKQIQQIYDNELRRIVHSMAQTRAEQDLAALLKEILPTPSVAGFLKVQELVNPTPKSS